MVFQKTNCHKDSLPAFSLSLIFHKQLENLHAQKIILPVFSRCVEMVSASSPICRSHRIGEFPAAHSHKIEYAPLFLPATSSIKKYPFIKFLFIPPLCTNSSSQSIIIYQSESFGGWNSERYC